MVQNNLRIIRLLFCKYIAMIRSRGGNLWNIFFLLAVSFFFVFLINSFSFGLLTFVSKSIGHVYGDVYVEFTKKMNKKEIKKKGIELILSDLKDIKSFFLYGVNHGIFKSENDYLPVYLVSYMHFESSFCNYMEECGQKGFLVGTALYQRFLGSKHKKIFLIKREDSQKKVMHFDAMPFQFKGYVELSWDEWNEKAIFIPIEKIENFFEIKSINALNIYVHDKKCVSALIESLKKSFKNDIRYISSSSSVLPEYTKFLAIISMVDSIITYIIFFFSFFLLFILIAVYLNENTFDYSFLLLMGISRREVAASVALLFLFLVIVAASVGFLSSHIFIFLVNYFKLFCINAKYNAYFVCTLNYSKIFFYIVYYIIFLIIFLLYRLLSII